MRSLQSARTVQVFEEGLGGAAVHLATTTTTCTHTFEKNERMAGDTY